MKSWDAKTMQYERQKKVLKNKNTMNSLFNWGTVSRTLTNSRSAVTEGGRGHVKHKVAIEELKAFEKKWIKNNIKKKG